LGIARDLGLVRIALFLKRDLLSPFYHDDKADYEKMKRMFCWNAGNYTTWNEIGRFQENCVEVLDKAIPSTIPLE